MLDELIQSTNKLFNDLENAAQNEKIYTTNICLELERYSWEMHRMMNDIKQIQEYFK